MFGSQNGASRGVSRPRKANHGSLNHGEARAKWRILDDSLTDGADVVRPLHNRHRNMVAGPECVGSAGLSRSRGYRLIVERDTFLDAGFHSNRSVTLSRDRDQTLELRHHLFLKVLNGAPTGLRSS